MGAIKHVELLLGVGVPQDHGSAVGNAAQQGTLQHGQPQVMDGLKIHRSSVILTVSDVGVSHSGHF